MTTTTPTQNFRHKLIKDNNFFTTNTQIKKTKSTVNGNIIDLEFVLEDFIVLTVNVKKDDPNFYTIVRYYSQIYNEYNFKYLYLNNEPFKRITNEKIKLLSEFKFVLIYNEKEINDCFVKVKYDTSQIP